MIHFLETIYKHMEDFASAGMKNVPVFMWGNEILLLYLCTENNYVF